MSNYTMPGNPVGSRTARVVGIVVVAVVLAVAVAMKTIPAGETGDRIHVQLRTEQTGSGITGGTPVQLDGVAVGEIASVTSEEQGRQQAITLDLERAQIAGLTDHFDVEYAPANLFGISALVLKQTGQGAPLRDGATIDLTGAAADRVSDLTLQRLLGMLTEASVKVLTPQLTDLLTTFSGNMKLFRPVLESLVTLSTSVADTQRYLPSYLLDQYGSLIGGAGEFAQAIVALLKNVLDIDALKNERALFDQNTSMMVDHLFPSIANVVTVAHTYLGDSSDMFIPLLQALAGTVPAPATSRTQLTELLDRLDRMFTDTPGGPALNLEVIVQNIPGLSVPLLGQPPVSGGPR